MAAGTCAGLCVRVNYLSDRVDQLWDPVFYTGGSAASLHDGNRSASRITASLEVSCGVIKQLGLLIALHLGRSAVLRPVEDGRAL